MKYILDTNALLNNPDFIKENEVLLIPTVLRELENLELKRTNYDMQYRIRCAKRIVKEFSDNVEFLEELDEKNLVKTYIGYETDYGDNIILAYILNLKTNSNQEFKVYTDDVLLQMKLKAKDIQFISTDEMDSQGDYKGVHVFYYDVNDLECQEILSSIYNGGSTNNYFDLTNNEYLEVVSKSSYETMDMFRYCDYTYTKVKYKHLDNDTNTIKPRNPRQALAIDLLLNDNIPVKALYGEAGTGKDVLIFNHALQKQQEDGLKIVWIGNSVLSKGTNEIGFLPGSLEEKLKGNFMVLSDILGGEFLLNHMIQTGDITIEYVGNLRSRTFNNSYIIVGEAQNFTIEQLKLILGRVGENSIIAFNGDDNQADISNSGYRKFVETLKDSELFGMVELKDVERSEIAKLSLLF